MDEKSRSVTTIQVKNTNNMSKEDSRSSKRFQPSSPIDIPQKKIKPQWVENTGWIKYQEMYR